MNRVLQLMAILIASTSAATADRNYRIVDLNTGVDAYGINDRGQVLVYLSNAATIEFGIWDNGSVTPLHNSFAFGINARGEVGGTYYGQNQGQPLFPQAFVFDGGVLTPLGVPSGATASQARAINNRGQIVGDFSDSSALLHPFLWESGAFTALPQGPSGRSGALAISDSGIIVGYIPGDGGSQPAMWEHGKLTKIGVPPGLPSFVGGHAFGVNNRGDVLLRAGSFYVWRKGVFTKLPDFPFGWAYAINDRGDVACTQNVQVNGAWETRACVWQDGKITALPTLGGSTSIPRAINNSGDLAGVSTDAEGVPHAVVWVRR